MTDLVIPSLCESITEAVIGKWLVSVGEHVGADEPVVDLETDKITVQLPAPVSGALTEQKYAVGDTVRVGDIVGQIDPNAEGTKPAAKEAAPKAEPAPEPAKVSEAPAKAEPAPAVASAQPLPDRDGTGRVLSNLEFAKAHFERVEE